MESYESLAIRSLKASRKSSGDFAWVELGHALVFALLSLQQSKPLSDVLSDHGSDTSQPEGTRCLLPEFRAKFRLSQSAVAALIGSNISRIYRLELGKQPTDKEMIDTATVFKVLPSAIWPDLRLGD